MMDFEYFYGKQSSQYAFYRIPKQLFMESQFDALSIGAKLLYGMMIDRMELSQKNGWIDKHAEFIKQAEKHGIISIKGHRAIGGMRASLYNAMPIEGVQHLVVFMREFEKSGDYYGKE